MSRSRCSMSEPAPEPSVVSCSVSSCQCLRCSGKCLNKVTNFLRFCRACSVNRMAFAVGISGVACGAGVGRMWTGSGLFLGWIVALGSKFMGME